MTDTTKALADIPVPLRESVQLLRERLANDGPGWRALCEVMQHLAASAPEQAVELPTPYHFADNGKGEPLFTKNQLLAFIATHRPADAADSQPAGEARVEGDGALTYAEQRKAVEHMTTELRSAIGILQSALQRAEAIDCQPITQQHRGDAVDRTIRELQSSLPWTIRYSRDFRASPQTHKDMAHALHHVSKAAGKLHGLVDDMDHDREVANDPTLRERYGKYVADLVVCAIRISNTFPGGVVDLQRAVQDRIAKKNALTANQETR